MLRRQTDVKEGGKAIGGRLPMAFRQTAPSKLPFYLSIRALSLYETCPFDMQNLPFWKTSVKELKINSYAMTTHGMCENPLHRRPDNAKEAYNPPPAKGKHGSAYALRTSLRLRTCSWSALVVMWLLGETDRLLRQGIIIGFHDVADGSGSGRRGHAFQFWHLHDL